MCLSLKYGQKSRYVESDVNIVVIHGTGVYRYYTGIMTTVGFQW